MYYSRILTLDVTENSFSSSNRISSLEHVVVKMSLRVVTYNSRYDYEDIDDYEGDIYDWLEDSHPRRGDIKIELTSPHGTKSVLLPYRRYDFINAEGYDNWPFMSVHFWGENTIGTWTLKITYKSSSGHVSMTGLSTTLHGTATTPTAVSSIPSVCHSSCARRCFGEGPEHCDSCTHFRLASTLQCIDQCPINTHANKSYCFNNEVSPTESLTTTVFIPTDERPSANNSPSTDGGDSENKNTVPIAVGITAGVVVMAIFTIILSVVIYLIVYSRKRRVRSEGFIQLTNEVET